MLEEVWLQFYHNKVIMHNVTSTKCIGQSSLHTLYVYMYIHSHVHTCAYIDLHYVGSGGGGGGPAVTSGQLKAVEKLKVKINPNHRVVTRVHTYAPMTACMLCGCVV